MLEVKNLNVWYGVTEVLRDVSFNVPNNKIVTLLGGNGSGKTTVLNTLSGLLAPRGGSITFNGSNVTGNPSHQMVKNGLVQVPQGREVFSNMSVKDNLELGGASLSNRKEIQEDIERMFDLFPRLRERARAKAGSLSGGEQQMVAVARAMIAKPKLLLMDEPSVGLAPKIVDEIISTIIKLRDQGLTILIVEQNVGVAAAVAEEAYVLKDGEIGHSGPAVDLMKNEEVLKSYLGR